jgi:hypothetical protein
MVNSVMSCKGGGTRSSPPRFEFDVSVNAWNSFAFRLRFLVWRPMVQGLTRAFEELGFDVCLDAWVCFAPRLWFLMSRPMVQSLTNASSCHRSGVL